MQPSHLLFARFANNAALMPSKALFERPGKPDLSYGDALETVQRIAAALVALGVLRCERVAVQVDKSAESVLVYLACLQIGAVFLPLNTAYTPAEVQYFLGDAQPRLFICRPETLQSYRASEPGTQVESLGAKGDGSLMAIAAPMKPRVEQAMVTDDDMAAILYTSGTTGRSKGAMLSQGNLASNCAALLEAWQFTQEDRLIHALPIFHTHGLFVAINMTVAAGATMIFLDKFDAEAVIPLMANATVLMGVPTFYSRLLQSAALTQAAVSQMRLFVSGSAPLAADVHRAFSDRTNMPILERYGMTETCMITTNPYTGERRAGTVGFALPGVELQIADRQTGTALPKGEIGSIEVRGPNVFQGYWQMPEKTAAEFRADGFFITGDLGRFDADGYLQIVGRDKDLVISGGYNIYPKEVERLIDALPGVAESAVIGLPHPDLGEAVTAVVVARPGAALDQKAVLSGISADLARFKQPKTVIFVTELPRNIMGKVQKNILRDTYAALYAPNSAAAI